MDRGVQDAELGRPAGLEAESAEPADGREAEFHAGAVAADTHPLLGQSGDARAVRRARAVRWAITPVFGLLLLVACAVAASRLPHRQLGGDATAPFVQEREKKSEEVAKKADADDDLGAASDDDQASNEEAVLVEGPGTEKKEEDEDEEEEEDGEKTASREKKREKDEKEKKTDEQKDKKKDEKKKEDKKQEEEEEEDSEDAEDGEEDADKDDEDGGHVDKCEIQEGVDFETSKALFAMQGIASQSLCRQKCRDYSQCGAWTWGRTRDDWGLMNMCFLKGLGMDEKPVPHKNEKVVSGLPCREPDRGKTHLKKGLAPPSDKLTKIFDVKSLMPAKNDRNRPTKGEFFCFALMLPGSYEQGLLKMQYEAKANIFACDKYQVYSSMAIELEPGLTTKVVDSNLKCEKGGEFGTALNTEIFMAVWKRVISDMVFDDYRWTVKADPDTVFIVSRLARVVRGLHDSFIGVYLNNCRMGMHGPLEVFSRQSVWTWGYGAKECFVYFYNLCSGPCLWGEDMFIDQCLTRKLHVERRSIYTLLTEAHCDPPENWDDCTNDTSVAFHPFKDLEKYKQCLGNAQPELFPAMAAKKAKDEGNTTKGGAEESEKGDDDEKEDRDRGEDEDEGNTLKGGAEKSEDEDEDEGDADKKDGKGKKDGADDEDEDKEDEEGDKEDEDEGQESDDNHSKCKVEDGVDYETKKALFAMEGIVSAKQCRKKCEKTNDCGAWTWGKTRDVWGLTNMCFLKALDDDEEPKKHSNPKVVSGHPCRKPKTEHEKDKKELAPSEAMQSTFDLSQSLAGRADKPDRSLGLLFCWALMLPHSYEVGLLRWQHENNVSLFACDSHAVYSNQSIEIAKDVTSSVVNTSLFCQKGGEFGTALNTDIFMKVWKKVLSDGTFQDYEWTVKVDPDSVFIVPRLRGVLGDYRETERGVYLNNCRMGLHGPIEVFSRNAVRAWSEGSQRCFHHFYRLCSGPCLWGEDMFIDQCLEKVLKVRKELVDELLTEDHCAPPEGWKDCKDPTRVAFHPFKKLKAYKECTNNALAVEP